MEKSKTVTRCQFCHGWKELEYHPLLYKTRKCKHKKGQCNKAFFCPFYHLNEEKRKVEGELKAKYKDGSMNKSAATLDRQLLDDLSSNDSPRKHSQRQASPLSKNSFFFVNTSNSNDSMFSMNTEEHQEFTPKIEFEREFKREEPGKQKDFLAFLVQHGFAELTALIEEDKMSVAKLVNLEEELIMELCKDGDASKITELKGWLLKLDDQVEGDKFMNIFSGTALTR